MLFYKHLADYLDYVFILIAGVWLGSKITYWAIDYLENNNH